MREGGMAQPLWLGSGQGEVAGSHNASFFPTPSHRDHTSMRTGTGAPTQGALPVWSRTLESCPGTVGSVSLHISLLGPGVPFSHRTTLSHFRFNSGDGGVL